jgi:hypothetical protein
MSSPSLDDIAIAFNNNFLACLLWNLNVTSLIMLGKEHRC